jgi:restriction system protein
MKEDKALTTSEKRIWGIHSKNDSSFLDKNTLSIGWHELKDLNTIGTSKDDFKQRYIETFPADEKAKIAVNVGQIFRFVFEMNIGDYVIFPSKNDRNINIGIVESDYIYNPDSGEYPNQRKVKWLKHLPRTKFSQGALYEIGSAMTLFSVKNYADEYLNALKPIPPKGIEPDNTVAITADDIVETTKDFILKELSKNLKGYDLEPFIADLLESMGYHTTISPHGGDNGIDIVAYKDELPPRILVQSKSQDGHVSEKDLQALKGAMREGDYGLFVALSDYSKNANKYLENTPIIRGINGTDLVELILKYYDKLSEKYRKIIPLKMVYIPICSDDNS